MHEDLLRQARALPQFAAIRVVGPDARAFLQGQLSNDILQVTPQSVLLASCNSAQGRVQAVLWILQRGEDLILLTAADLLDSTIARLRKYVLRAKVQIEPAVLSVLGTKASQAAAGSWRAPLQHSAEGELSIVQWPGARKLIIAPAAPCPADDLFLHNWRLGDVQAGVPQVHATTYESFVAQMLNLDVVGGISFDKGCYTGQEIIARAHFRGTVKRRMFRYAAKCEAPEPGTRISAANEPAGEVVSAAGIADGCELLAVVQLAHVDQQLRLDLMGKPALKRLELPYELPDGGRP